MRFGSGSLGFCSGCSSSGGAFTRGLRSIKHPFTAFGGIGVYAETPQAGKRQPETVGHAASPFMGKLAAKRTEGACYTPLLLHRRLNKRPCLWAVPIGFTCQTGEFFALPIIKDGRWEAACFERVDNGHFGVVVKG